MISKGYQTELNRFEKGWKQDIFLILNWFLCCLGICGMLLIGMVWSRKFSLVFFKLHSLPSCSLIVILLKRKILEHVSTFSKVRTSCIGFKVYNSIIPVSLCRYEIDSKFAIECSLISLNFMRSDSLFVLLIFQNTCTETHGFRVETRNEEWWICQGPRSAEVESENFC